MKDELQNYDNDFVPIVTEGFQYLTFIIEQCSAYYLPFIHQTKVLIAFLKIFIIHYTLKVTIICQYLQSLCQMGLVAKISLTLKRIICATFDKLLTMCNEYDMNIGNVTVVLVEKLRLNYIKSTRGMYNNRSRMLIFGKKKCRLERKFLFTYICFRESLRLQSTWIYCKVQL